MEIENLKTPALIPGQQIPTFDDESQGLSVGEVISVFVEYRWVIAVITALAILFGAGSIFVATPIYKANALLQIEEKSGGMSALKDLQPLLGGDTTSVAAELEILTSRMVLGRVIEKLKLDIEVKPKFFSAVGSAVARRYQGDKPNSSWFGLSSYAWGGEILQVDALDVPRELRDKGLILTVGENGSFKISNEFDELIMEGVVGVRADGPKISIFVARMLARPGTQFFLSRRSTEYAVAKLREGISVKERGKKSGILEISMQGPDRERNAVVLDEVLNSYVRQNVERRSAETESTLAFLEMQLPKLKKELDSAEAAYNAYRQNRGSLDLSIETQSVLESVVEVDNQIVALKQERDELRQSFTSEHPRIQAVDQRLERLRERRKQFDIEVSRLPDTQQRILQLSRDVEVSTTLYTNLLNTAQQLRVTKAGTVGDVRIIDSASAFNASIGKNPATILFIAGLVGLGLSIVVVFIMRSLRVVVESPELIESKLGLPVYAAIPHSDEEILIARRAKAGKEYGALLAIVKPEDDAVESLRGLRTTIHFALMDAKHNSVQITGPSPGLGKSFMSKNLGVVLAQAGKRVVILDADLRKGHINKEFGLRRENGISEYVAGSVNIEEVIQPTIVPNLWVVTTGQIPPNPSELLMHLRFEELLEKLGTQFDTVIVDAPPILAVSDAAIIGRLTGATLMIARAGFHPIAELEQAVKRLNHGGVQVKGFIFNDLNTSRQRYRYGIKGYVYRYSYSSPR